MEDCKKKKKNVTQPRYEWSYTSLLPLRTKGPYCVSVFQLMNIWIAKDIALTITTNNVIELTISRESKNTKYLVFTVSPTVSLLIHSASFDLRNVGFRTALFGDIYRALFVAILALFSLRVSCWTTLTANKLNDSTVSVDNYKGNNNLVRGRRTKANEH